MINLLQSEYKKYKGTYIYSLGLLGMISPVILIAIGTFMVRDDLITQGIYTWHSFYGRLVAFFVYLIGPLLTSFIAISAVNHEYQSNTIGNILTTPYSRLKVILGKLGFVSLLVMAFYICVALANILCAFILGFTVTSTEIIDNTSYLLLAGVTTLVIVPLVLLLTVVFRSFIPAMIISVAGTIPNFAVYHSDKCYLSPWGVPEVIVLKAAGFLNNIDIVYPLTSILVYAVIFISALLIYFQYSDQY